MFDQLFRRPTGGRGLRGKSAVRILCECYAYLEEHGYRVLSTELPDDLLNRWLLPMPGEVAAAEYRRYFADKNTVFTEVHLPFFVFDQVLRKRYNRDLAQSDEVEINAAADDLRTYVELLNYISGMRGRGLQPFEFDIFDVENYDAIAERIAAQAANPPEAEERLTDEELIAHRGLIFNDLIGGYIDAITGVLKEYLSVDISRCDEVLLRVVLRDVAHFDMNPDLDIRENSRDMFVDKVEYVDDESFSLYLTEANVHLDDIRVLLLPWRKVRRTDKKLHIVIKRGETMCAPYVTPMSFVLLKDTIRRYDAWKRGERKQVGIKNSQEMKAEAKGFIDDIRQAAERHSIDMVKMIKRL